MTFEQFLDIVELQLGRKKVKAGDDFREDLHAESLDLVLLVAALEDRFQISIPEAVLVKVRTVEDLFEYLQSLLAAGGSDGPA